MYMTFDGSPWGYESDLDVEISHITGSPFDPDGDNPVECEWAIQGWTRDQHAAIPDDMVEKLDEATIAYVINLSERRMRALGWEGPCDDVLLISTRSSKDVVEMGGDDCIIARIKFETLPAKLGDVDEANARLIAAYSDLLAALTDTLRMLEAAHHQLGVTDPKIVARKNKARAAIAAATGEPG